MFNIIFIWIPKTAGTSIFNFLEKKFEAKKFKTIEQLNGFSNEGCVTFSHMSYINLLATGLVNINFHEKSYKFTVTRCPYDRAVSLFNYSMQKNWIANNVTFEQFLELIHTKRPPVGLYNVYGLSQTNPQVYWIIGYKNGFFVDNLFRLSELSNFAKKMKEKYNVDFDPKLKNNESKLFITKNKALKNRTAIDMINTIYARDFDLLGYKKF